MKGFLLFTGLIVFVSTAIGCAAPTAVPPAVVPTTLPPPRVLATVTPQPIPPISVPTAIPPTSTPQVNLGATKTYRDQFAGFEFDYPATWNLTPIGDEAKKNSVIYSATFFSWKPTGGSSEGIPAGGTMFDVGVNKNDAASPQAALEMRKQEIQNSDLGQTITSEEDWTLPSGLKATRLTVASRSGDSVEVITALNGKTILFGGVGDYSLLDAIAQTLRPI